MRYAVANVVYNNRPTVVRRALAALTVDHQPDVWLLVETKNVNVKQMLGHGWRVHQGRSWDLSRANSAIAWREPVQAGRSRFILGTLPLGHALLTRWINRVRLKYGSYGQPIGVDVMHLPPSRDHALYPGFLRNIETHARNRFKVWAGDMNNADLQTLAARHGLELRAYGVMFLATNLRIHRVDVVRVKAFDHGVLIVDVDPPKQTR